MDYKYKAFISYRHLEPDMQAAEKLQKLLEAYKPPKNLGKTKENWRIFRDVSELQSSSDLSEFLKLAGLKNYGSKEEKLKTILSFSEHYNILPIYRRLLKEKYKTNWQFLKEHFEQILPIDVQSFFSAYIEPSLLYETQKECS